MTINTVLSSASKWHVEAGDARDGLSRIPDGSAQCVVTSPPYFNLRAYFASREFAEVSLADEWAQTSTAQWNTAHGTERCRYEQRPSVEVKDKGGNVTGYLGQIAAVSKWADGTWCSLGQEESPAEFVAHLVEIFREVKRVLRDDGVAWINIGDSYAADRTYQVPSTKGGAKHSPAQGSSGGMRVPDGLKAKDMIGVPWMLAFALRADGWHLRSDVIWERLNVMPESVQDRPTRSHEHVFLLSKSADYFYDAVAIAERVVKAGKRKSGVEVDTRNARDVWYLVAEPFAGDHNAAFPSELPRRCLLAGTSENGCCPACGAPWERLVEREGGLWEDRKEAGAPMRAGLAPYSQALGGSKAITTGWQPTCKCPPPTRLFRASYSIHSPGQARLAWQRYNRSGAISAAR